jgi:hypothetical protein
VSLGPLDADAVRVLFWAGVGVCALCAVLAAALVVVALSQAGD